MCFICESCGKEHDGSYGKSRFCSRKCSFNYARKFRKKEIIICEICKKEISKEYLNRHLKKHEEEKIEREKEHKCENCGKEHDGSYGSGRFCCERCSKQFSTKNNKGRTKILICEICGENKEFSLFSSSKICKFCRKIQIIKKYKKIFICCICHNEFTYKRKIKTCSPICLHKLRSNNSKLSINRLIKENRFQGWKTRKDKEPSYAEKYFITLFENEKIIGWKREYKEGKYFIDFAFIDKKIALEIDGKQHNEEDRKISDKNKDIFLERRGWKVIRIKWFNPVSEIKKQKLYTQIEYFKKEYYKN